MPDDTQDGDLRLTLKKGITDPRALGPFADFRYAVADWTARGVVSRSTQGLVISHIEIDSGGDGAGITITMLRDVPVRAILARAQSLMAAVLIHPAFRSPGPGPSEPVKPQPGRAPLTDDFLRDIALEYLAETAPGKPRGAIGRLAKLRNKPTPTVSRWVGRTREAGWLGPAVPGREGAEPGPRLLAIGPGAIAAAIAEHMTEAELDEIDVVDPESDRPAE